MPIEMKIMLTAMTIAGTLLGFITITKNIKLGWFDVIAVWGFIGSVVISIASLITLIWNS